MTTADTIACAVEDLRELKSAPPYRAHVEADLILCRVLTELGAQGVVDEWKRVKKWYA